MSQTIAIILTFRREDAPQFEAMFKAEVYPLWEEFKSQGKVTSASLTPAQVGTVDTTEFIEYILHLEVPGLEDHNAFDSDPRFLEFLKKAQPMQPEEPKVWFGDTLLQV